MKIQTLGCLSLIMSGCYSSWEPKDADGDGTAGVNDCWESSEDPVVPTGAMIYDTPITASDIFVGAEDRPYDGIDQNCDGQDDFDQDGDGFVPNEYVGIQTLGLDASGALSGGDCDDEDVLRHPDTEELCDGVINGCAVDLTSDEIDDDGDGFVECSVDINGWQGSDAVIGGDDCDDEDAILFPTQMWYLDADDDDFGDGEISVVSCTQPIDHVLDSSDCDDSDASVFPVAPELCDGLVNACGTELSTDEIDNDGDGYVECAIDAGGWDGDVLVTGGEDCSDQDGTVHVSVTYFADVDEDGFGDISNSMIACEQPSGFILDASDCDDTDATVFPSADELCDGQYNDCSHLFYDATSAPVDELDTDGDAYVACSIDAGGWDGDGNVDGGDDCDPADPNEFPGQIWYADSDGDGFGNAAVSLPACAQPSNTSLDSTDCDDTDATVFPSAPELCDGQPNTCGAALPSNEVDSDGDGYSVCALDAGGWDGTGNVIGGSDCDDGSAVTHPSAAFNESSTSCMIDVDGDGYGGTSSATNIVNGSDCDDTDSTIFPSAPELCDGQINSCGGTLPNNEIDSDQDGYVACTIDSNGWDGVGGIAGGNDCDPTDVDEFPGQIWYADVDGDGFGDPSATSTACVQPANTSLLSSDCDDSDPTVFNNAPELCDGQPNACGTTLATNEIDNDGDGYVECAYNATIWVGASVSGGNDCDDTEPLAYPGAAASDSSTACMLDADLDGYGDSSFSTVYSIGSDCNDDDDTVYPNATELCDGQINACGTALPLVEFDSDGDGYLACDLDAGGYDGVGAILGGGDCAPVGVAGASKHPYADESANDGVDSNCDGMEAINIECEGGTYVSNDGTIEKYFLLCDEGQSNWLPDLAHTKCVNGGYQGLGSLHSLEELEFAVDLTNMNGTNFSFGRTRNAPGSPWFWKDGGTSSYEYLAVSVAGNAGSSSQYTMVRTNFDSNLSQNVVFDWRVVSASQEQSKLPFLCSYTF